MVSAPAAMEDFLTNALSFPTVPFTVLLGIVLLYWIFALVTGAVFDAADGAVDAVSGGIKGAGDAVAGGLKGAGEAVAGGLKGAGEVVAGALGGAGDALSGALDGAGDAAAGVLDSVGDAAAGAADSVGDAVGHAGEAVAAHEGGLMALLGIGQIPVTMTASVAVLATWTLSAIGVALVHPESALLKGGIFVASPLLGFMVSALVLRPFGKALAQAKPARRRDALGRMCTITSGRVDASFGTAVVEDGGAGLNVLVVCPKPNTLKKGDKALLLEFDRAKDVYEVEPADWLLPEEVGAPLSDVVQGGPAQSERVKRR